MTFLEEFENDIPIIDVDIKEIQIKERDFFGDNFVIRNLGKGILNGTISSRFKYIKFDTNKFYGNINVVNYYIDLSNFEAFDEISEEILIISNGGEKVISIFIKILKYFLEIDNQKITTLEEFYIFSQNNYRKAMEIFFSDYFIDWLHKTNYKLIDIYYNLIENKNDFDVLEKFFLINDLKKIAKLEFFSESIDIKVNYSSKGIVCKNIKIKKITKGNVNTKIEIENNRNYLELSKINIVDNDFDEEDNCDILCYIDMSKIVSKYHLIYLYLPQYEKKMALNIIKIKDFNFRLNKSDFKFYDHGLLHIENRVDGNFHLEIDTKDKFVVFEKQKFYVLSLQNLDLEFEIKLSKVNISRLFLGDKPMIETKIYVKLYNEYYKYKETINLNIGSII